MIDFKSDLPIAELAKLLAGVIWESGIAPDEPFEQDGHWELSRCNDHKLYSYGDYYRFADRYWNEPRKERVLQVLRSVGATILEKR
jgi:hypothetical protein